MLSDRSTLISAASQTPYGSRTLLFITLLVLLSLAIAGWASATEFGTRQSTHYSQRAAALKSGEHATGQQGGGARHASAYGVAFRTALEGYALTHHCVQETCRYRVWVTTDGGTKWQGYSTPIAVDPEVSVRKATLTPMSEQRILLSAGPESWVSDTTLDTWRRTSYIPTLPVKNSTQQTATLQSTHAISIEEHTLRVGIAHTGHTVAVIKLPRSTTPSRVASAGEAVFVHTIGESVYRIQLSDTANITWQKINLPSLTGRFPGNHPYLPCTARSVLQKTPTNTSCICG